ncbi:MAG: oligopeptidase B [Candidatus Omnitrophota bacterium]
MQVNKTIEDIPEASQTPFKHQYHNQEFVDSYAWLKDRDSANTRAHLEKENKYFDSVMSSEDDNRQRLYAEMVARIKETDQSAPEKDGEYVYYSRTLKGEQYSICCRKKTIAMDTEEVILDLNKLAKGHDFFDLGISDISSNHQILAFSTDVTGDEIYTIRFKDLISGELLDDELTGTCQVSEWAEDNRTFFYGVLDDLKRPYKIMRHELGTEQGQDVEVYVEKDDAFFVNIYKTKDSKYLIIESESKNTTEARYVNTQDTHAEFEVFEPRRGNHEYSVDHHENGFYILTNDQAENFRLMSCPDKATGIQHWQEVLEHRPNTKLEDMDIFKDFLVVHERTQGLMQIRVTNLSSGQVHYVKFDEPIYTLDEGSNPEYDTQLLRFHYCSLISPHTAYDYNMGSKERVIVKTQEIMTGYDKSLYMTQQVMAQSKDGTLIPISLVMRKDRPASGPLHLYGYGSYGITIDPTFSSIRLSLLDRGIAFAIAHVRGGGYLGRPWYMNGKLTSKQNTFDDFIACAEHLINEKVTTKDQLIISGGSAGGLLVGATLNQRPDLFLGAITHVPFVDVVNTMMDEALPLTITEYDEWGDPHDKQVFDRLLTYSPYENISAQHYPHIMVTAGLNDSRVQYWEPAKWVAKLRTHKTDTNTLILKTHMQAGHAGPSGRYEYIREVALDYAFMLKIWKIKV